MARASKITDGNKPIDRTPYNALIDDYLSQTDTGEQNIAGKVVFATVFEGTGSGTSPITIAHGLGDTPTKVFPSANALQPYALGWTADATNVYVYHNAAGSLTVSVRAVL